MVTDFSLFLLDVYYFTTAKRITPCSPAFIMLMELYQEYLKILRELQSNVPNFNNITSVAAHIFNQISSAPTEFQNY